MIFRQVGVNKTETTRSNLKFPIKHFYNENTHDTNCNVEFSKRVRLVFMLENSVSRKVQLLKFTWLKYIRLNEQFTNFTFEKTVFSTDLVKLKL